MQGFILSIRPVRDEDLWVWILTSHELLSLYRFYGARHSVIALGHKIDFGTQVQGKRAIACLRDVLHLGFKWEQEREKKLIWQMFIQLLFKHIKDIKYIEDFYYSMLCVMSQKLERQNPYRLACECYAKLLLFEGRANTLYACNLCGSALGAQCVLSRSFLGLCDDCANGQKPNVNTKKMRDFIKNADAMLLEDDEIKVLWNIITKGF